MLMEKATLFIQFEKKLGRLAYLKRLSINCAENKLPE